MLSFKRTIFATVLAICLTRSEADTKCTINFGFCQNTQINCPGIYLTYLCNGPASRKCCVPAFNDERCQAQGGKCQGTTVTCFGGRYHTGMCGGPINRRCCILDTPANGYNDEQCQKTGGKCQHTDIACMGGSYATGLCGGPANRRCCLPHVTEESEPACGRKAQHLACELLNSPEVISAGSQASSATLTDTPFANLRDMCKGRQAIRHKERCQPKGCKDVGRFVCVHEKVLQYLVNLKNQGRIVIAELTGGCHPGSCKHQRGRAVDLHRDGRDMDYIRECLSLGGTARPHADAIHCHFTK
ncbi:hypothetical protein ACOMHN_015438 [Nucella lapillus]